MFDKPQTDLSGVGESRLSSQRGKPERRVETNHQAHSSDRHEFRRNSNPQEDAYETHAHYLRDRTEKVSSDSCKNELNQRRNLTKLAILLAKVLNPQNVSSPPIKIEKR